MKITYASDMHLEYREYRVHPDLSGDVLVLAGDIVQINQLHEKHVALFFNTVADRFNHVIYVAGNHEFFDGDLSDVVKLKNFYKLDNLHILNNECLVIDDIQFIGGTGWTSFNELDARTIMTANKFLSDFRRITVGNERFNTYAWLEEHDKFIKFLAGVDYNKYTNVVVSHHSPSVITASPHHQDDFESNGCYCADLLKYINNVSYWIYGHAHDGLDVEYNGCKIVSNIRGYPNEEIFNTFEFKSFYI